MSSRLEFATLVLFVLVLMQRTTRQYLRTKWDKFSWRGVVVPIMLMFSFAKVLTFAWSPFGDGFDACYRSLYYPLENPSACEKSYEGPFLRQSDLGLANTSRIDRTVDFGVHQFDWSLPFMNEYPRLGNLWLERFPFTAQYGAVIENRSNKVQYLPIISLGKVDAQLAQSAVSKDYSPYPQLSVIPVPVGRHELSVMFEFSDDDETVPPESAPSPRGPYASLKIGAPINHERLEDIAMIRINGWVFNQELTTPPNSIEVLLASGETRRFPLLDRPDVANHFKNSELTRSGFDFAISRKDLVGETLIRAIFDTETLEIGRVQLSTPKIGAEPDVALASDEKILAQFSAWLTADRNSIKAYEPDGRRDYGIRFDALALLIEVFSALIFLALLWVVLRSLGFGLVLAGAFGMAGWVMIYGVGRLTPPIMGIELLAPIMLLSTALVAAMRWLRSRPAVTLLPLAVVLAHHEVSDHLRRFHSSKGVGWWGRLLYWWRDSDWYATRGFARTIFNEGSLEGGHAVFWFQAGPRYWSYFTQVLLGEQDVLIGLIMVALSFFVIMYLAMRFASKHRGKFAHVITWAFLSIGLIFQSDEVITIFGFVGSSEHPTWIVLFALTGYLLTAREETRTWLLVGLSALVAYMAPMRPNQIGGVIVFFVMLLLVVSRIDRVQWFSRALRMTAAFSIVISLALLHNLYYGESFVPFAGNASINVQFEWTKLLADNSFFAAIDIVWTQVRAIFYWGWPVNWNWALVFWGSQLIWLVSLAQRVRLGMFFRWRTLTLLLPVAYALPMLKFQLGSYYPRHLVIISLSCMCAGLLAWPGDRRQTKTTALLDGNPQVDDGTARRVAHVESGVAQLA
jgi:hypothetical protein